MNDFKNTMGHHQFMHRCLELAQRAQGKTGTNPMVGAVLVRDGNIVAEAFHRGFGLPHAERALLEEFQGSITASNTLYVNLEPCCHTGKTPPCTDIIIERGVEQIVYGMLDPDPRVSGKGITLLTSHGIHCIGPVERASAEWLNRGFVSWRTKSRPWITLHRARTRDGKVSNPPGEPRLIITSEEQDRWSHRYLRGAHDAIVAGIGTIERDDPKLNKRFVQENGFQPLRIVLDPHFRIAPEAKVVSPPLAAGTMLITAPGKATGEKARDFRVRGVAVFEVPLRGRFFDLPSLWHVLTEPRGEFSGVTSLLIEGGPRTWEVFESAGVVDMEVILVGE